MGLAGTAGLLSHLGTVLGTNPKQRKDAVTVMKKALTAGTAAAGTPSSVPETPKFNKIHFISLET